MKIFSIIALGLFLLTSCVSNTSKTKENADQDSLAADQTVTVKSDTLNEVLDHYFALKEALVASNTGEAAQAAQGLSKALSTIEGCETTAELAQQIENNQDLEKQRSDFSIISKDLIAMYQHADVTSGTLYVAHCPMYNNNQGGDWLSSYEEIANPYFGDKMMRCGSVKQKIQ